MTKVPPNTGSFISEHPCDIETLPYGYVHCRCPSLAPANRWKNKIVQPFFGWTGFSTRIPLLNAGVASRCLRRVSICFHWFPGRRSSEAPRTIYRRFERTCHGGPAMKRAQFLTLVGVTLGIVFSAISPARAQQQPLPVQPAPSASQNSSAAQAPTNAQQRADLVRKRAEWFQKQRAYPNHAHPRRRVAKGDRAAQRDDPAAALGRSPRCSGNHFFSRRTACGTRSVRNRPMFQLFSVVFPVLITSAFRRFRDASRRWPWTQPTRLGIRSISAQRPEASGKRQMGAQAGRL